ncbi:MAG: YraN family protein [Myxococcales bacterium]|nr:YraN family protein [Myxococcales bacterium]
MSDSDPRHLFGHEAEERAAAFLTEQGYRILERNLRTRLGEVDIVAMDGDTLVFVEVRSRRDASAVHPAATVNRRKQRQVVRVAMLYCQKHTVRDTMIRFDVVAVLGERGPIELIRNAFEAGR